MDAVRIPTAGLHLDQQQSEKDSELRGDARCVLSSGGSVVPAMWATQQHAAASQHAFVLHCAFPPSSPKIEKQRAAQDLGSGLWHA